MKSGGGWRVAGGGWRVAGGGWRVAKIKFQNILRQKEYMINLTIVAKMNTTNFERLQIYNKAVEISEQLFSLLSRCKDFNLKGQLIRSADSIGANIAEGCGRGSKADKRRFAIISRGSCFETKHWIMVAMRRKMIEEETAIVLLANIDILCRQLSAFINSLNK